MTSLFFSSISENYTQRLASYLHSTLRKKQNKLWYRTDKLLVCLDLCAKNFFHVVIVSASEHKTIQATLKVMIVLRKKWQYK